MCFSFQLSFFPLPSPDFLPFSVFFYSVRFIALEKEVFGFGLERHKLDGYGHQEVHDDAIEYQLDISLSRRSVLLYLLIRLCSLDALS